MSAAYEEKKIVKRRNTRRYTYYYCTNEKDTDNVEYTYIMYYVRSISIRGVAVVYGQNGDIVVK